MSKNRKRWIETGEHSSGTLRLTDLIEATIDALSPVRLTRNERQQVRALQKEYQRIIDSREYEEHEESKDDELFHVMEELTAIAEQYTPPCWYWGSTEGDSASIGCFLSDISDYISFNEDCGRCDDPSELKDLPSSAREAFVVNDHGNVTMYQRRGNRWVSIWAVV